MMMADDYWITYNIHDLKIFQLEDIMIGIQSWSYIGLIFSLNHLNQMVMSWSWS